MKTRAISILHSYVKDETFLSISDAFKSYGSILQLDILQDAFYDLQNLYDEIMEEDRKAWIARRKELGIVVKGDES